MISISKSCCALNKRLLLVLAFAAFIALQAATYSSESGDEWSATEKARFRQAKAVHPKSKLLANVSTIDHQNDGTTNITFHATGRWGENQERGNAAAQISKDYVLTWNDKGRPVPWFRKQVVKLGVNDSDLLSVAMGIVVPQYFRYSSAGEVELLVRDDERFILVCPHMLGSMDSYLISFDWIKGMGIVMTNYELYETGGGDSEIEEPSGQNRGIRPINAVDHSLRLGRDGWRDIKSVQPKQDPPEGYIGHYRKLVPLSQRIKCVR